MSDFFSLDGLNAGSIIASLIAAVIYFLLAHLRLLAAKKIGSLTTKYKAQVASKSKVVSDNEFSVFLEMEEVKSVLARYTVILILGLFVSIHMQIASPVTLGSLVDVSNLQAWIQKIFWMFLFYFAGSLNRLFKNYANMALFAREQFITKDVTNAH